MTPPPAPMVRSEMDAGGRLARVWIPSVSTPGHTYEMVRTGKGWAHTDRVCTVWLYGALCGHLDALTQFDREMSDA